jgi:hypothetical protein
VHEKILGMGMPRCITYDVVSKINLEHWKKFLYRKPGILSFGHQVDLEVANKNFTPTETV